MLRSRLLLLVTLIAATVGPISAQCIADIVETISGTKYEGKIVLHNSKYIHIKQTIRGKPYTRKFPERLIHAVTIKNKRKELRPLSKKRSSSKIRSRSKSQVLALIAKEGRKKPDWFDSTDLNYPKSLDLAWPMPPPKDWNSQKNIGQFLWDVVNPNPGRWRGGVRLMHHLLKVHEKDPETRARVMNELGRMYHVLLQDYPRAAFWSLQARKEGRRTQRNAARLAECYWRLGNRKMGHDFLKTRTPNSIMIKTFADMGYTDEALKRAKAVVASGNIRDVGYFLAAEACRVAGRNAQAVKFYDAVLDVPAKGKRKQRIEWYHRRARANADAIRLFDRADVAKVRDGTYTASSLGYVDQIHVAVKVADHRITQVKITRHKEKQFYAALTDTPQKIIKKQSVEGIDATSSATLTSEAIINATAKALAKGSSG